ncbi:MAG TPA: energy transducer TonB, partial [Dyella sp.]|nr:energy transducer TonB [Dyella sp.]
MNTISRRVRSALFVAVAVASCAPVMAQEPRRVPPEQLPYTWVLTNSDVSVDVPNSGVNIYKPGCV